LNDISQAVGARGSRDGGLNSCVDRIEIRHELGGFHRERVRDVEDALLRISNELARKYTAAMFTSPPMHVIALLGPTGRCQPSGSRFTINEAGREFAPSLAAPSLRTNGSRPIAYCLAESVVTQRLKFGRLGPATPHSVGAASASNRRKHLRSPTITPPKCACWKAFPGGKYAPLRLISIGRYNHGLGRQAPLPFCETGGIQASKTAWCRERTPLVGATTGRVAVHFFLRIVGPKTGPISNSTYPCRDNGLN
jgi:hypothetical protein